MKNSIRNCACGLVIALMFVSSGAMAASNPIADLAAAIASALGGGQPNQSCQAEPLTPGGSASAPGSAFNPDGKAGTVYAGTQPQNSKNPKSVSQYDVACYQVSN